MTHRILIVEDNPIDQRLFEQALSDPSREIEICSDGREALGAFERRAADVVISDIMMPNMEGSELLAELHRRGPTCRSSWSLASAASRRRWRRCTLERSITSPNR